MKVAEITSLSGEPVAIAEVTKATGINAAELADVLLAEDLCAETTAELAAGYVGWVSRPTRR